VGAAVEAVGAAEVEEAGAAEVEEAVGVVIRLRLDMK
jgi:hypothetical protein